MGWTRTGVGNLGALKHVHVLSGQSLCRHKASFKQVSPGKSCAHCASSQVAPSNVGGAGAHPSCRRLRSSLPGLQQNSSAMVAMPVLISPVQMQFHRRGAHRGWQNGVVDALAGAIRAGFLLAHGSLQAVASREERGAKRVIADAVTWIGV